jgi:hypothetical protein
VLGYTFLGGHAEEIAPGVYRLYPADGLRQRFHFRGDYGLSIQTDGLRLESLEWDLNRESVRVYLERIPEESHGRVTLEARDCAAEWVNGSEGFRYAASDESSAVVEMVCTGVGDGADVPCWLEIRMRKSDE